MSEQTKPGLTDAEFWAYRNRENGRIIARHVPDELGGNIDLYPETWERLYPLYAAAAGPPRELLAARDKYNAAVARGYDIGDAECAFAVVALNWLNAAPPAASAAPKAEPDVISRFRRDERIDTPTSTMAAASAEICGRYMGTRRHGSDKGDVYNCPLPRGHSGAHMSAVLPDDSDAELIDALAYLAQGHRTDAGYWRRKDNPQRGVDQDAEADKLDQAATRLRELLLEKEADSRRLAAYERAAAYPTYKGQAARAEIAESRLALATQCVAFADMVRQATHPTSASWGHYDQKRALLAEFDRSTGE